MSVVFRCDANGDIGYGHFSRCLSLASALANLGQQCTFAMYQPPEDVIERIQVNNHQCIVLSDEQANVDNVSAFNQLLKSTLTKLQLLVVDHYQLSTTWRLLAGKAFEQVMVFNDSNDQILDADILLNASGVLTADNEQSNRQLYLYGPQFAQLNAHFQQAATNVNTNIERFASKPLKILISIGATDPNNTTNKMLHWLLDQTTDYSVTIATTSSNSHLAVLEKSVTLAGANLLVDPQDMAALMNDNQLMITAPGNMMWEACAVGIPSLFVQTDDGQNNNVKLLKQHMTRNFIGHENALTQDGFITKIKEISQDADTLSKAAVIAHQLCDGQGATRAANAIMKQRKVSSDDNTG